MNELDFMNDIKEFRYTNKDTIASMIPYLLEGVAYALDIKADPLLRKHIAAAIFAYKKGDSFEEILTSMNDSDYSDENALSSYARVRQMVIEFSYAASQVVARYFQENFGKTSKVESQALTLFILSMERLSMSFKASVLLLNSGFFVEVSPIFRLIYEQLAWGCYLVQETDEEKIMKNKTQSNVRYLKDVLKNESYGKLYSVFSKETHLEPDSIHKYLYCDSENCAVGVRNRSGKECDEATIILILLLKMFGEVIWHGMNRFGFPETGNSYFQAWFEAHFSLCQILKETLDGNIILESCDDMNDLLGTDE